MSADRFGIVGRIVARTYQVEDVVAEGGFGVVYRAHHKGFRAKVALKCLKIPVDLTEDQRRQFLEQFRSEAEVLFRLTSRIHGIVRPLHVDAFHTDDGRLVPFMALEWLEGRTLDAIILRRAQKGRPPLSLESLVQLLTPVASALEQAHNLPGPDGPMMVVHRDMKPENLFIARDGEEDVAKILDFGISKVKSAAGQLAGKASQSEDAFVSFSPAYAAPEQWAPRRYGQTGRWTDVWGLALTVVEAAKGAEVIEGDHAAMMGTILDPGRRPTPRNEGIVVSDEVEAIFERALAVDPRRRYQSVGEFWDELTEALGLAARVGSVALRDSSSSLGARSSAGLESVAPPPLRSAPEAPLSRREPPSRFERQGEPNVPARGALPSRPHEQRELVAPRASSPSLALQPVTMRPRAYPSVVSTRAATSIWKHLTPALSLLFLSVALTVLDRAFVVARGVPIAFGPLKLSWVAAGIFIIALAQGISAVRRAMQ